MSTKPLHPVLIINGISRSQVKLVPVLLPQSARKIRGKTTVENIEESGVLLQPELHSSNSRRPTRSKLWEHPEEEHPLLDSPLEVDSETPVADALIKRLQDEEEKEEGMDEIPEGKLLCTFLFLQIGFDVYHRIKHL